MNAPEQTLQAAPYQIGHGDRVNCGESCNISGQTLNERRSDSDRPQGIELASPGRAGLARSHDSNVEFPAWAIIGSPIGSRSGRRCPGRFRNSWHHRWGVAFGNSRPSRMRRRELSGFALRQPQLAFRRLRKHLFTLREGQRMASPDRAAVRLSLPCLRAADTAFTSHSFNTPTQPILRS